MHKVQHIGIGYNLITMNGSSVKDVRDYMILHAYFIDMFANHMIKTIKILIIVTILLVYVYCAKNFILYNKNLKQIEIKSIKQQLKKILKFKILKQQHQQSPHHLMTRMFWRLANYIVSQKIS